jgi:hypothetical protein
VRDPVPGCFEWEFHRNLECGIPKPNGDVADLIMGRAVSGDVSSRLMAAIVIDRRRAMSTCALKALMALLLSFAFEFAVSQTVLSGALRELTRYYGAAATVIANAVSGVNKVEAIQIPQSDRFEVRDELKKISFAISMLRATQAPLVFDLSHYVDEVRASTLDRERRESAWRVILYSVDRVSNIVNDTLDVVETSRWLKVTLDEQDRLALREVLLGRVSLLQRLRSLPAPSTTDEIDQLDQMSRFYRQLMTSLGELNVALLRATERLKLE